jgi:hypothetical protein
MSAGGEISVVAPDRHRHAAVALSGVVLASMHKQRATGRRFAFALMLLMWGAFAVALYILVAGA